MESFSFEASRDQLGYFFEMALHAAYYIRLKHHESISQYKVDVTVYHDMARLFSRILNHKEQGIDVEAIILKHMQEEL